MAEFRDPVCGMMVDPANAAASSEHDGQTYYFCSIECKEAFDLSPERYAITDEGPRFTKSMGFPAPKFGSATSGGAEYEPPTLTNPAARKSRKRTADTE
jgi:YHS domain-containing protein